MWKKINDPNGLRQADAGYYNGEHGPGRNTPSPGPQREPTGLPRLPYESIPPRPPGHREPPPQEPVYRPASSNYIQPPHSITTRFPRQHQYRPPTYQYAEDEVSPPSSPELGAVRSPPGEDDEVSPIDEEFDISALDISRKPSSKPAATSRPPSSGIPVLRREKRRSSQLATASPNLVPRKEVNNAAAKTRQSKNPHWDPYSGEITTSDKGKPQSVKPGEFTPPGIGSGPMPDISPSAPTKSYASFGERVRKMKNSLPAEKPEWKGATGRASVVSPVADQTEKAPFSIPRKSSRRVASPVPSAPFEVPTIQNVVDDSVILTRRPYADSKDRDSPRAFSPPPASVSAPPVTTAFSPPPITTQVRQNAPTEVSDHQRHESMGSIERNFREALKDVYGNGGSDPYIQPPSRFSVTTYAPSEAQSSARPSMESDRPPVPTTPPTSILNRKRPRVVEATKATTRKAVQSSPVKISMTSSIVNKRNSNMLKNLPQTPLEVESRDLITSLEAKLENLGHRKNNLTRSIRQMTELMPKDNLVVTTEVRRKRDEEKKKVEALREEEADVQRELHDIGLRLHRAYKRKDKEATYEPTGLWVRRVTT